MQTVHFCNLLTVTYVVFSNINLWTKIPLTNSQLKRCLRFAQGFLKFGILYTDRSFWKLEHMTIVHHNAFNWKWFCFTGKNSKVSGTDVFYLASLLSSSLMSDHALVSVNITDLAGQSIFSYATEEKQVKWSIVNF